jgi:hypothetical protein
MSSKRKTLNEFHIKNKRKVLGLIGKDVSQRTFAMQFGVAKSTTGNINKNRDAILKFWKENCSNGRERKLLKTDNEAFISSLYDFFRNVTQWTSLFSGPMLRTKAKEIAQRLEVENFQALNGWLESFRTSHNINFKLLSGESAAVDMEAVED